MDSSSGEWFNELEVNESIWQKSSVNKDEFIQLDRFVGLMRTKLNNHGWYAPVAYTPHDFDHHIVNVLTNASKLLVGEFNNYSIQELLALQYACVLHDIDMVYNPLQREKHSLNGAQIISSFIEKNDELAKIADDISNQIIDLTSAKGIQASSSNDTINNIHTFLKNSIGFLIPDRNMQEAISLIVLGHSDIKIQKDKSINTLDSNIYKKHIIPLGKKRQPMKLRVLAAIMRFADELDCSKQRVSDISRERNQIPKEAEDYWDKLELIDSVNIEGNTITLRVNESFIKKNKRRGFVLLKSIEDKIEKERVIVNKCFREESNKLYIHEIVLDWGGLQQDEYEKEYIEFVLSENKKKIDLEEENEYDVSRLKKEIIQIIEDKELYRDVHRRISGKCIRTYLDCNGILTKHQILDRISQVFINAFITGDFSKAPDDIEADQFALVGVANSGVMIAAHMSYVSGISMLYYVPPYKENRFTTHEKKNLKTNLSMLDSKKVALVIGVNHTGSAVSAAYESINKLIEENQIKAEVCCLLGVVNRDVNQLPKKLLENGVKAYFLIENRYPIEWCHYEKTPLQCPHSQKCKSGEEE